MLNNEISIRIMNQKVMFIKYTDYF